jgi:hypothetical protein
VNLEGLTEKRRGKKSLWYENAEGEIVAKQCSKCGEIKTVYEYVKGSTGIGGRKSECKVCAKNYREYNQERINQYREDNRELLSEYARKFYKKK